MHRHILAVLVVSVCLSPPAVSAADLQAAVLANPCAGCHGMNGVSAGSIPPINHLGSDALVAAMSKPPAKSPRRRATQEIMSSRPTGDDACVGDGPMPDRSFVSLQDD